MGFLAQIKKDPAGAIAEKMFQYRVKWTLFWGTRRTYFSAKLKGVKVGQRARFFGRPLIRRAPLSTIKIGDDAVFRSSFHTNLVGLNRKCLLATAYEGAEIRIGNNAGLSGTVIGAAESVVLGDDVLCGANVLVTDFDWHPVDPNRRRERADSKPVVIEDNVWLGVNSIVLKGVRIGRNSVIAANSVVVKDIPANVIAGGNPAKVIKQLDAEQVAQAELRYAAMSS
ncbi:acyltransferase [Pontibacter sp. G13]|uniref:acyltransferase n=1 Tax=Pontibacter sp. G13 TaxID=3074898 RepID=UPI0028898422|nr:acyltransferase [Pontibacter sp. G13]WNJ19757.1 acyltransferase [Pontibacter sp. G13]